MRSVSGMFGRLLGWQKIPMMARPTLRQELASSFFAAIGSAPLIWQFTQLFARKSLGAPSVLLAVLVAEMAAGNLCGMFLARHLRRHRRVPYVVAARMLIALVMLAVAALPASRAAAVGFAAIMLVPAILAAVALNMQTGVWNSNFPDSVRGRIFSYIYVVKIGTLAIAVRSAGYALEIWPDAHRMLYPVGASAMVISALIYRRIRVRGERGQLRASAAEGPHLLAGFRVLRTDRTFARFMFWQMISGSAVLMSIPVITMALTDHLHVDYHKGTTAMALVPLGTALLAAPIVGRWFDRMGITRFRAMGAAFWALSRLALFAGVALRSWPIVLQAFVLQGLGQAPGGLAFTIGHMRFAPPHRGQLYMGVHMTLQGVRGLTMPLLGIWLYGSVGLGVGVLVLAGCVQLIAAAGFLLMRGPTPQAVHEDVTGL